MTHYQSGQTVDKKADASPVTEADRAADRLIVAKLQPLTPVFAVVSEEGEKPDVAQYDYFWLVDPLDGTKSFVRGNGYFTVNIALIDNQTKLPVFGVIYEPVHETMYYGTSAGAFRIDKGAKQATPIKVRAPGSVLEALVSHSHLDPTTDAYLVQKKIGNRIPCASSIKFCWLAEGKADLYPRFGPTSEWDTAAGHAILLAAGGTMTTPEGEPFIYGKPDFRNGNFIANSGKSPIVTKS